MTEQHSQTAEYFTRTAEAWRARVAGDLPDEVNVPAQRFAAVERVAAGIDGIERHLDLGCGSGDLLFRMAARGIATTGIDFAPSMIEICERRRAESGTEVELHCSSIFDAALPEGEFDLVTALGLIEYLSLDDLDRFWALVRRVLRPGGRVAVGSRNRLFNATSAGRFTQLERSLGTLDALSREVEALVATADQAEAIAEVRGSGRRLPHPAQHPRTVVEVDTRYQFPPSELVDRAEECGELETIALLGVHYHALPPASVRRHRALHVAVAEEVHRTAMDDPALLPWCSTFVLGAERKEETR